jgi:hypothetical protein
MRKFVLAAAFALVGAASVTANAADPSHSRACDPRNVPSNERADLLHQNRPGGSDCTPQSARRTEQNSVARERQLQDRRYDRDARRIDPRDEPYSGSSLPPDRAYRR